MAHPFELLELLDAGAVVEVVVVLVACAVVVVAGAVVDVGARVVDVVVGARVVDVVDVGADVVDVVASVVVVVVVSAWVGAANETDQLSAAAWVPTVISSRSEVRQALVVGQGRSPAYEARSVAPPVARAPRKHTGPTEAWTPHRAAAGRGVPPSG
jgi:hypothetical protein